MSLDANQIRNYSGAFAATRAWCFKRNIVDPAPYIDRVAMVLTTESNGRMPANGGEAFPDFGETPWTENDDGTSLSVAERRALRALFAQSLDLPHDSVGNNGGSTGMYQQLSRDYVVLRFPGHDWGWGTMAETMDIKASTKMFLDKLCITNDPVYRGITFSSPITADVLRVQQPMVSESSSSNYGPARLAGALAIVTELGNTTTPIPAPIPVADTLEEIIMADHKVIAVVTGYNGIWIAFPLGGIRVPVATIPQKDKFLVTLDTLGLPYVDLGEDEIFLSLLAPVPGPAPAVDNDFIARHTSNMVLDALGGVAAPPPGYDGTAKGKLARAAFAAAPLAAEADQSARIDGLIGQVRDLTSSLVGLSSTVTAILEKLNEPKPVVTTNGQLTITEQEADLNAALSS